ncbi:MAG: serine/threonine protein kinase [Candidatus Obscuribacterales bacterium]|jgi:tRNA A-37 threonylcarbamoyl transferase component Bud32|nr:serine/threonine protein kinase [Candidatus Obscuribacterales bacterium]
MAELTVKAKYSNKLAKTLLYCVLALIPVWGCIIPIGLLFMIVIMIVSPREFLREPLTYSGLMGGMLLASAGCAMLSIVLADDKLIATRDGLRIPFHLSLRTGRRRDFAWSEIEKIIFSGDTNSDKNNFHINLTTKSGAVIPINCAKLTPAELEQILLAIELWGANAVIDERIIPVKERLQNRPSLMTSKEMSYTAVWEEEMERRFGSTAFVVLEPDTELQEGKLHVVRQLAFGGLSAVYLCQIFKRDLAVLKESVVPADASAELKTKAEEMFAREARLLMGLQHKNIVRVMDYFVEAGRNYMLLEHIDGPDLRQYVKRNGPQPEHRCTEWAKLILEALQHLHERTPAIIHRDISPDNIVLEKECEIKIIDFGAANEFIGTATGTLVGKQSYLPLEQLRGKAVPQSDLYGLGCTLHFILTGEDPEPLAVSHPRQLKPEISEELDALIARCTDPDPSKRPQSAAEMRELLNFPSKV